MPVLFIRNCVPSVPRRPLDFVLAVFMNVRSAAAGEVISAPSTIQEYALLITSLTLLPVSAMDLITSTGTVALPFSSIVASESLVSFPRSAATSLQLFEEPPITGFVLVGVVGVVGVVGFVGLVVAQAEACARPFSRLQQSFP